MIRGKSSSPAAAFLGTSFSSILVAVLTFVSGVLIARALGPEARAEYGTVLLIGQTVATLGSLSFFDGAIVRLREDPGLLGSVLPSMVLAALAISLGSTAVAIVALAVVDTGLVEVTPGQVLLISALLILSALISQCFSAAERSRMDFFLVNLSRVTGPAIFSLLIVIAWVVQDGDLSAYVVLMLFILAKLPVLTIWLIRYARHIFGPLSWSFLRDTGRIGLKLHMAIAVGAVAGQIDRLIAIGAWSKDLLGLYFVAFSAVGAGYGVITTAINTVLFPYLAGMEARERQERVHLIIRLTLLISLGTVLVGLCILPFAIPLLYGADYLGATPMALGLLGALAVLPLRAVVLEAGRSLGKGRPSVEMALVSITVMMGLYGLTGFATPAQLIVSLGLANLLSMLAGARHLVRDGVIRPGWHLLPGMADARRLSSMIAERGGRRRR
ncbi:lipopolysaccharide biosynthesis protein [Mameliella sp.]|uniref:lipopolysaccharide biosynthesis protein n=1 Tax=Mameliella sp. TaxID=1924940 RepID=UPI003BABA06E